MTEHLRDNYDSWRKILEIEKKFLIKELPENLGDFDKKEIEQAYLNRNPVLRIRKSNDRYIFTYKMRKSQTDGGPLVNEEIEAPLTEEAFKHLKTKADGNVIIKTRYIIPYSSGGKEYKIELDVFHGKLDGLVFAEVEFESEEDADSFVKPDWFGKDVSGDSRYANAFMVELEDISVFKK